VSNPSLRRPDTAAVLDDKGKQVKVLKDSAQGSYGANGTIASGVTIDATDVAELRAAVKALRASAGLGTAFAAGPLTGDEIQAADFTTLISAVNEALSLYGRPAFAYSGVPRPAADGFVEAQHVLQLREVLK
jgi:hypothetical protein